MYVNIISSKPTSKLGRQTSPSRIDILNIRFIQFKYHTINDVIKLKLLKYQLLAIQI